MGDLTGQFGVIEGPTSKIAWFISAFTQSTAYHVVVNDGDGNVISALPRGVTEEPEGDWANAVYSHYPLTVTQKAAIMAFLVSKKGHPYNYVDDGLIAVSRLFDWKIPKWLAKHFSNGKSYQCAQLVDAAYEAAGIHLFTDGRAFGEVVPGDLLKLLVAEKP